MAIEKISIKAGPPVEGADFYGRETELQASLTKNIIKIMKC